jgi:hypothetical protein
VKNVEQNVKCTTMIIAKIALKLVEDAPVNAGVWSHN